MRTARTALWCACLSLLAPLALARSDAPTPQSPSTTTEQAVRDLLRSPALRGARVGVSIVDLASGVVLYEREPRRLMVPASNLKLLVSAAALDHWGPTHRFETPILVEAAPDPEGVVEGPLWVVGSGDPSLVSESLWKLAEEIRLLGVREIRGGLAVDGGAFDRVTTHPDWGPITRRAYEAPTSAFAVNYSSFRIEIAGGGRSGDAVRVDTAPRVPYFRTQSRAQTFAGNGVLELDLRRAPDGNSELIRVSGLFPLGDEARTFWRSVALPERYAASVLRAQLEAQGIRVGPAVRFGSAPEDALELIRFEGEPVARIVHLLNKWSNNFVAEQLTKLLGAERFGGAASWPQGVRALVDYLERQGIGPDQAVIADGSGLSARNRISPRALVRVLRAAAHAPASGPEFLASLPLAGLDGTLEDRMLDLQLPVRGKTGHLRHVSSLTGVIPDGEGGGTVFSVLVNGARGGRVEVDAALDAFVAAIRPDAADRAEPGEPASGEELPGGYSESGD